MLKSADLVKLGVIALLIIGAALATYHHLAGTNDAFDSGAWFLPR